MPDHASTLAAVAAHTGNAGQIDWLALTEAGTTPREVVEAAAEVGDDRLRQRAYEAHARLQRREDNPPPKVGRPSLPEHEKRNRQVCKLTIAELERLDNALRDGEKRADLIMWAIALREKF